ncbi:MAG: DUF1592 domain-containing protein [Planctomycetes bacterium]|nr:DUF1592 domain-containing protein [Planctomycetota bacterium]
MELASKGELGQPTTLHDQVERMLADPRSTRFINDFVGQWLKLNQIAATDPDKKTLSRVQPKPSGRDGCRNASLFQGTDRS